MKYYVQLYFQKPWDLLFSNISASTVERQIPDQDYLDFTPHHLDLIEKRDESLSRPERL